MKKYIYTVKKDNRHKRYILEESMIFQKSVKPVKMEKYYIYYEEMVSVDAEGNCPDLYYEMFRTLKDKTVQEITVENTIIL